LMPSTGSVRVSSSGRPQPVGLDLLTNAWTGFFYVINFGLSQEEVDRQFSLCKQVFEHPEEEKMKYRAGTLSLLIAPAKDH
jgi:hypothetical protein